jgi:predicted nucleic acid-binding protein
VVICGPVIAELLAAATAADRNKIWLLLSSLWTSDADFKRIRRVLTRPELFEP